MYRRETDATEQGEAEEDPRGRARIVLRAGLRRAVLGKLDPRAPVRPAALHLGRRAGLLMTEVREIDVLEAPAACCAPLAATRMSQGDAETPSRVFKALGDPHRVRIVNLLANAPGPACVCDLTPELGLSQPTVSFHLKKLVQAGLLERERRGAPGYYSGERAALRPLSPGVGAGGGGRGATTGG